MKNTHLGKVHFIGIGGSGVSGVAALALKMGYEVTGCDLEKNTAYASNVFQGHDSVHIKDCDLVVVSPAVFFQTKKIPEVELAKKDGKLMTWQEFLGKVLLKQKKLICIAGTHGKSTTTAMAGKLLVDNGFDPIVVLGAMVPEWGGNSRFGNGEYAVIEADEFNNNFLHYNPDIAIVNNVEFDHPDFFKDEEDVKKSFENFKKNLVGEKVLITQEDSLNKKFNLKVLGSHNQKNANMVFLLGKTLGIEETKIIESIEGFVGISRRMELIGEKNGIKIYDDYAHHPTAIAATLEGLRRAYPQSKIWTIVEPHGYSRTNSLLSSYKGVFDQADNVIIGPIFKARDVETFGMTPDVVAEASEHKEIVGVDSFEKIKDIIVDESKTGDVVIVMGAGKSYVWAKEILKNLGTTTFKDLTAFKIGGKIKHYKEVKNKEDVVDAVRFAKENKLSIFILGDGTDILASDNDFGGVVVRYTDSEIKFNDDGTVVSGAGANWDELVELSVEKKLQGIECLSGIPGTVGAAPIQNIGAYGQELKDTFVSLEAYDIENEKFVTLDSNYCDFGYRESVFKRRDHWQKYLICSVTLKLQRNKPGSLGYESLKKEIQKDNPSLLEIREVVLKIRSDKFENPRVAGNAGSFFKNPIIESSEKERLESKYPGIKIFKFGDKFKVSAGWLIEKAGWKGRSYKTASVSKKHALVLINKDWNGVANDFVELSDKIISDIKSKFKIKLEREVQLINFQ